MTKATKKPAAKKSATATSGNILENANIVHALSYVPYFIGAVAMYFFGQSNKKAAMHHIKYSVILAVAAIIATVFLMGSVLGMFIVPVYLIGSGFLAWKAYNGEDVHVEILDTIEDKIAEKVKK